MKTEILIPMWPNQRATSDKLGCGTRYRDMDSCDSFWIPFRAKPVGEGYEFADSCSVWSDIGLYVWMSNRYDTKIIMELKGYSIHSADMRKLKLLIKTLKWAHKRLEGWGDVTIENLPFKLIDFAKRLGIKRTIQYTGMAEDQFAPVDTVLALINQDVQTSFERLKKD